VSWVLGLLCCVGWLNSCLAGELFGCVCGSVEMVVGWCKNLSR
jgi:hypothetical protein